jgi:xanthine dehydrogenase accessory factor
MTTSACIAGSDPGIAEPEWPPAGQDLRDVALPLRLLLNRGFSLAIATVVGAHGGLLRRQGTVLVTSESGETIGFHPGGPLDGAIRDLATEALATGQDRLERLEIDEDAASYIGMSGRISLDIHATRVQAGDPVFARALRCLGSGAATVAVIGTRRISGYAVIGADHVTGYLGWPELQSPLVEDARSMLGSCHMVRRTYGPDGQRIGAAIQVWMQGYPREGANAQPGLA